MADKRAFAKFDVGYLDNPKMADVLENPARSQEPIYHRSAGKMYCPQRYVVGWRDGIVKVGSTANGHKRWGPFLARGGTMLDLAYYEKDFGDIEAESWLQGRLKERWPAAFSAKGEAAPYLGNGGAGYLECFSIPDIWWSEVVKLARS